ncbi:MAG: hypothetical protein KME06_20590 [Kastovskya adunca ATA6-11-RM4]|nr:hypothetical protein [Kastovskya adunca ATA6-11-RM4]
MKAGLVQQAGEWEFSSYLEYAGLRKGTLPKRELIGALIEGELAYQQFLADCQLPSSISFKQLLLDE